MPTSKISNTSPTPLFTEDSACQSIAAALIQLPLGPDRTRAIEALEHLGHTRTRRQRILVLVQEALGQLRLDMKYLVFDLNVTRDERDQWKEKFESQS